MYKWCLWSLDPSWGEVSKSNWVRNPKEWFNTFWFSNLNLDHWTFVNKNSSLCIRYIYYSVLNKSNYPLVPLPIVVNVVISMAKHWSSQFGWHVSGLLGRVFLSAPRFLTKRGCRIVRSEFWIVWSPTTESLIFWSFSQSNLSNEHCLWTLWRSYRCS